MCTEFVKGLPGCGLRNAQPYGYVIETGLPEGIENIHLRCKVEHVARAPRKLIAALFHRDFKFIQRRLLLFKV